VHTITIESSLARTLIELQSAATWARGPGRAVTFSAEGAGAGTARMNIEDRVALLERGDSESGTVRATIQVATVDDCLTMHVRGEGHGRVTIASEADRCVSETTHPHDATTVVLFLVHQSKQSVERGGEHG
jgi:hypothetical protein